MYFTQPTTYHILIIESDTVQSSRNGRLRGAAKSMWVCLEEERERKQIEEKLADLYKRGRIKLYVVSACEQGDDYDLEQMFEELDELDN